jgi:hypothetical protein
MKGLPIVALRDRKSKRLCDMDARSEALSLGIRLTSFGPIMDLFTAQPQNTKRRANCMKRGVVRVDRYLPNSAGSKESEG